MIYYEEAGKKEDQLIKQYFTDLRSSGHPFDSVIASQYQPLTINELSQRLRGIEGKKKSNPILQIADLCLYPVARSIDNPGDRAYIALKEKHILVDSKRVCKVDCVRGEKLHGKPPFKFNRKSI